MFKCKMSCMPPCAREVCRLIFVCHFVGAIIDMRHANSLILDNVILSLAYMHTVFTPIGIYATCHAGPD